MKSRRKILINSYDMCIGGVERSLIGLLSSLDYSAYDVDLLLFRHVGELMDYLPDTGYRLLPEISACATIRQSIGQVIRRRHYNIAAARLYAKLHAGRQERKRRSAAAPAFAKQYALEYSVPFMPALEKKYDVAVSYLWPHNYVIQKVQAEKKIGWVHTDYSRIELDHPADLKNWERLDQIVAVSDSTAANFLQIYPSLGKKVQVIENIIIPELIWQQARGDVSEEMPDNGAWKILTVGRFGYAKGFDTAVEACRLLAARRVTATWYLIGYGNDESLLRRLIAENNLEEKCVILGKKTNPYPYMRACDLYVQPSRFEGKAVSVTEAQILHKPVLITDFPSARSQLRDGYDGYIVANSPANVADGIIRLIEDNALRERLIENTCQQYYFSMESIERFNNLIMS